MKEESKRVLFTIGGFVLFFLFLASILYALDGEAVGEVQETEELIPSITWNDEANRLIKAKESCKSSSELDEIIKAMENLLGDCERYSYSQKLDVDSKVLNKLETAKSSAYQKRENLKVYERKALVLNNIINRFDENVDKKVYLEQARIIVDCYYSNPKEVKDLVEDYQKFYRIEEKVDVADAEKVDKLIKKIGKVTYSTKTKRRILKAGNAYYALRRKAKEKVSNYLLFINKRNKYWKLEKKAIGYNEDLFGHSWKDPKEQYEDEQALRKYKKEHPDEDDEDDDDNDYSYTDDHRMIKPGETKKTTKERNVDPDDYDDGGDYADDAWGDDYDDWDDAYEAWEDEGW